MAAREDDARKAGEEDSSPEEGAAQKVDETVAGAAAEADVHECSDDDEADSFIRNLNRLGRLKLMPPEWIEEMRKNHYEEVALYNRAYAALENGEIESDDEAGAAEAEERLRNLWAGVDLSGVNTVGGESRGVDAVAVYPDGVYPHEEEGHDQGAAAAESTS